MKTSLLFLLSNIKLQLSQQYALLKKFSSTYQLCSVLTNMPVIEDLDNTHTQGLLLRLSKNIQVS